MFSFAVQDHRVLLSAGVFMVMGGFFSLVHERLLYAKREMLTARASLEQLETRVQKRASELAASHQAAELTKARLAGIVDSAMDAIISVDTNQRVVLFNSAAEAMFQYPAAEALGQPLSRFMPQRFREAHKHHLENFGKTGVTSRSMTSLGTLSGVRSNGEEFPIEASISQVEVASQKVYTVILRDITERKRVEETLKTKQQHAQSLLRLARRLEQAVTREEILASAGEEVAATLGLHAIWFYLFTEDMQHLRLVTADDRTKQALSPEAGHFLTIQGDPMLEQIAAADDLVVVEDARTDPRTNKQIVAEMGNRTILNMPVKMAGKKLGVIGTGTFGDEGVRCLSPIEQRFFAALASHVAVVVDRVQVLERRDAAEAALRQSAETQTSILNALPAHIALVDTESVILAVNESWERFSMGNSPQTQTSAIGENYIKVCERATGEYSEEAHEVAAGLQEVLSGKRPHFSIEYPCHSAAEPRWFRLMVTPLRCGQQAGAVVMHVDISDRKLAEATIRQSEERFRQLAESIQEVFWVTDITKHEMLYISPAYETIWGRSCESLYASPRTWLDAIHPDDRARVVEASRLKQTQGTYSEEYRIIRPDGAVRWIHDRAFPVRDPQGNVYRVAGVAQDISERKRAGDRLVEQASLLDKARDAILVRDLEHGITYWNKSAEQLYGWTLEEVQGRQASELLYRDPTSYFEATDTLIRVGEWSGELQQVTKAGALILVEARWTLVRDDAGQPRSVLAINTDITEKKKLEQQFLRAQRMESIGTLAGGIAHDLNNVLAPIMMSIDLLKLTISDSRAQEVLSTIEGSARRGADMVQQILSFARGVDGKRATIDAAQIMREMQHLIHETFPKNIVLQLELPDDLPSFQGDHTQVHQVLLNLCVNARDAMPSGGTLTLSATRTEVDTSYSAMNPGAVPGTYLLIRVMDTGTGIPPDTLDKIFDPFFTTKELGKGTGLGLSTVLAIVKSHGGFLNVYSELGRGTTFAIHLPANVAGDHAGTNEEGTWHPRGNNELILVVDDEAAVRTIAQQTLEAYGYRALVAANGAEAIHLYTQRREEVAVVLTDMMMPVIDGPAAIQVIKGMKPDVKIIAASGLASEGSAERAKALGVKHILLKPYSAHTVLVMLHEILTEGLP